MSSNRNKKSYNILFVVILVIGAGFVGNEFLQQTSTPSLPEQETAQPAVNAVWPPETSGVQLAQNLMAQNYYVAVDASGSMGEAACGGGGAKIDQARAALSAFAKTVPNNANLGLMVFHGLDIQGVVPLDTDNREAFQKAINAITPNGGTPLSNVISQARLELEAQAQRQLGYGEYHLVVVTDGEANEGYDPTAEVNNLLAATPVVLHTIGFCIDESHSLNQPGRTLYQAANDTAQLQRGLEDVLAEAPSFTVQKFE